MILVKDLIILVAKLLILIGDCVLVVTSPIWRGAKAARKIAASFRLSTKGSLRKNKEREIYNSKPRFEIKKPSFPHLNVKLPKISFPKIKFEFPKIELPRLVFPIIEKPKLPRIQTPQINLRMQPFFVANIHQPKKRGRKRLPLKVPFGIRLKYLFLGAAASFIFVFLPLSGYIFIQQLPNPSELSSQDIAQTTKIYDRNHNLLYSIYADQNRTVVPLAEIPQDLKDATIAIEDKNFYSNPGIDVLAILRSAVANAQNKPTQGGSTITQQLVKARLLSPERSFDRKVKEIVLSVWAQRIYTKNQILEMYLNQVPYGGTSWGVVAAV